MIETEHLSNGVETLSPGAPRQIGGTGYVILSREKDKDSYIGSCFRNNTVTIVTQKGEVIKNCFVSREVWQYLKFPEDNATKGSAVIWLNIPTYNRPVVIGVLNKKDELLNIQKQNLFQFERTSSTDKIQTTSSITGDGDTGTLLLKTEGDISGQGEIYVKCLNTNVLALLDMYVQGKIQITADDQLQINVANEFSVIVNQEDSNQTASISYKLGTGLVVKDEFGNEFDMAPKAINLVSEANGKTYIKGQNAQTFPVSMGNINKDMWENMYKLLQSIIITLSGASAGTYVTAPPIAAEIAQWQAYLLSVNNQFQNLDSKNLEIS